MIGAGGRESRCSVRVCRDRPPATLSSMIPAPSINASITPPKIGDRDADFIPARSERKPLGAAPTPGVRRIFLLTKIAQDTIKGAEKILFGHGSPVRLT